MLRLDRNPRRLAAGPRARLHASHGFDAIVHEVDDDAADLLDVEPHRRQRRRELADEGDLAEQPVVERQRVGQDAIQVGRHRARRRHARELRELVDQRLERFDLADDRRRAFLDQRARGFRRAAEVTAHPLGRELDRRERVLDFVRQPPRDVAPRRDPLRPHERGHVVEDEDRALVRAGVPLQRRRRRGQVNLAPVARERDLLPRRLARARGDRSDQRRERQQVLAAEHLLDRRADDAGFDLEEPGRRGVDRADAAVGPDRHDPGGDPLEDGLDVAAALVELRVLPLHLDPRPFQPPLARRQLARHRVERFDQRPELVLGFRLDPVIEMAGADLARTGRQHADRPRDPLREIQPEPGRADENHQRHHHEERQVDRLDRSLQDRELAVVLVRLRDPARVRRERARQEIAGDDDAHRLAGGVAHEHAGPDQLVAAFERLVRLGVRAPAGDLRGHPIRGFAQVAGWQRRRLQRDHLQRVDPPPLAGLEAVDLDQPDPAIHHRRRHGGLQRVEVS